MAWGGHENTTRPFPQPRTLRGEITTGTARCEIIPPYIVY